MKMKKLAETTTRARIKYNFWLKAPNSDWNWKIVSPIAASAVGQYETVQNSLKILLDCK